MLNIEKETEILMQEIKRTKKYNNPFFVIISGDPGSGKTFLAWNLSKYLKIICLSNDYIRNKIYQKETIKKEDVVEVENFVKKMANKRLEILFKRKISFVYDMNVNNKEKLELYSQYAKENNYWLIKIKINSKDKDNIKRIGKRKLNYNKKDHFVIGDNVFYSSNFGEKEYWKIKSRKPIELKNNNFDYIIKNDEKYLDNILTVIEDIKLKVLTK